MSRLIDDLLDVSRVTRGVIKLELADEDMGGLVRCALEQIRPLIEMRRHVVSLQLPPGPVPVRVDRTRMVQVVGNLLNNAAKYTPAGGRIEVALETGDGDAILSVKDNGSGIDAGLLPRVFDLFAQHTPTGGVVPGGLGIGLALARSITELHGGGIRATSDGPGRGSCFDVRIPLAEGPSARDSSLPATGRRAVSCRVVVVDDNVDAARTTALALEYSGHRVKVFHDGGSALAAPAGDTQVYLIDIGLPDMSGLDLARALRDDARTANATLIALTGYGSPGDVQRSQHAGFDAHLVKPLDVAKLHEIISDITHCE
jgi:CheY-like chemotaxis protein